MVDIRDYRWWYSDDCHTHEAVALDYDDDDDDDDNDDYDDDAGDDDAGDDDDD